MSRDEKKPLPCPFCGATSLQHIEPFNYQIICLGCGARGPVAISYEDGTVKWNTRKENL